MRKIIGLLAVLFITCSIIVTAGTTPPSTSVTLDGLFGQDSWYRSSIDVTLTATDSESGVASTTYWVDSDPPTTEEFTTVELTPFVNNSFEDVDCWLFIFCDVEDWYGGAAGFVEYYASQLFAKDGTWSAAMVWISLGGEFFHYHNEPHAVLLPEGEQVVVSAWARTIMFEGDTAYMEIWGQDINGNNDVLLATSNVVDGFNWTWQNVTATFTVPATTNYIYAKLGGRGTPVALIYFDLVEIRSAGGAEETVEFTYSTEGEHTLHYYSEDNNGNTESENTEPLKIDTVVPNPWENFTAVKSGCNHCYDTQAEVRDITSGVDVSTAEYRFYTEHGGQYWSDYYAVDSVEIVSTSQPATDGETSPVRLITPNIDFGDSAHFPFRVQFQICDLAGNCSTSPAYDIIAPWIYTTDGGMHIQGDIYVPTAPSGDDHVQADATSDNGIDSLTSSTDWTDTDYTHSLASVTQLEDIFPEYQNIKALATDISGSDLPSADGIYLSQTTYYMSASTVKNSYKNADISAVFIIEGDLEISTEFTVAENNNSVFLVEGDVLVTNQNVEEIAGFYIAEGLFDSDTTGDSRKQLNVYGSVIAMQGYNLPRDLGDSGSENNNNTPAEKFTFQPDFLLDLTLSRYLNNEQQHYVWYEIEEP